MLQYVETHNRIHLSCEGEEVFRIGEVTWAHVEIGPVLKSDFETRQVFRIDIRCDVALAARDEQPGEVAYAGSYLEHLFADIGAYGISHPPIEARRIRKCFQNLRTRAAID